MLRYVTLLREELNSGRGKRELARLIGIAPQSLLEYLLDGTEPRRAALEKMAAYFKVSVSALLSDDDDLDREILEALRIFNQEEKKSWLEVISKAAQEKKEATQEARLNALKKERQSRKGKPQ